MSFWKLFGRSKVILPSPRYVQVYGYLFEPKDAERWKKEAIKCFCKENPYVDPHSFDAAENWEFLAYNPPVVAANEFECFFYQTRTMTANKMQNETVGDAISLFALRQRPIDNRIFVGVIWDGEHAQTARKLIRKKHEKQ